MPRLKLNRQKKQKKLAAFCALWLHILNMVTWYIRAVQTIISIRLNMCPTRARYKMLYLERKEYMHRLVYESDDACLNQLRMNTSTFMRLCNMLETDGKLKASKYLQVDEQVAIFLYILAHHVKNRVAKFQFHRSGETISKHFNNVLNAVIQLENGLFKKPEPVWLAYIQVHQNAKRWRGKKFPHYWELCNVFGKDRANGRDAQTAADIVSNIDREEIEVIEDGLDDIDVNQPLNSPSYGDSKEESGARKRKRRNSWDPLMNSLKESAEIIGAEIRGASNTFNRVFGTESNREELRNNLYTEVNKVEGLSIRECDKAVCKLAQNEELMVIFFKVDEERKLGWVKTMLEDTA